MAMVINTNVMSLTSQRSLSGTTSSVSQAMERLSTGLRINSAKDDAAGLNIANRFTSQIKGLNQAIRNANDGISLAQTAEGALSESTDILQRMRELSIQSANATNSSEDRTALQAEVTQLIAEMDRIANTTTFGSRSLLNGTFSNEAFHVGSNANEVIRVSVASARTEDLGQINEVTFGNFALADTTAAAASPTHPVTGQTLTFNVDGVDSTVSVLAGESAEQISAKLNSSVPSLSADARSGARLDAAVGDAGDGFTLTINGTSIGAVSGADDAALGTAIATAIQGSSALSNFSVTDNGDGTVDIIDETGADITVGLSAITDGGGATALPTLTVAEFDYDETAGGTVAATGVSVTTGTSVITTGDIKFTTALDSSTFTFSASGSGIGTSTVTTGTITVETDRIDDVDITTVSGANTALGLIDAAIRSIDSQRADLGAVQNRMESTIANLSSVVENVSAARSRVQDADFASETAALTRSQILQQAGVAMLSQANAQPQMVLSLLQ